MRYLYAGWRWRSPAEPEDRKELVRGWEQIASISGPFARQCPLDRFLDMCELSRHEWEQFTGVVPCRDTEGDVKDEGLGWAGDASRKRPREATMFEEEEEYGEGFHIPLGMEGWDDGEERREKRATYTDIRREEGEGEDGQRARGVCEEIEEALAEEKGIEPRDIQKFLFGFESLHTFCGSFL